MRPNKIRRLEGSKARVTGHGCGTGVVDVAMAFLFYDGGAPRCGRGANFDKSIGRPLPQWPVGRGADTADLLSLSYSYLLEVNKTGSEDRKYWT
ncbi:unnamed protein product [Leptosia nina]|uniref:Uncharacterized protein n=1 Tax=Leptosia nina TaxID=320188 RepID=A0AAV1JGK0_9NEOP